VQVSNEHQWRRFCTLLGADGLAADGRFADNPLRVKNRDALRPLIQQILRTRPAREWERLFLEAGVPVSHVRGLGDVIADEQVLARNMVKPVRLAGGREMGTWGMPVKMNGQLASATLQVPGLDQHRDEILAELAQPAAGLAS
jgi:CoA:oxalate CoA-transferase